MPALWTRVAVGIVIVVTVVVVVELILDLFKAILPAPVASLVGQGAGLIYTMVAPALPPAMALLLIWGGYWLFSRSRGR
jgi:hypothetical protein